MNGIPGTRLRIHLFRPNRLGKIQSEDLCRLCKMPSSEVFGFRYADRGEFEMAMRELDGVPCNSTALVLTDVMES